MQSLNKKGLSEIIAVVLIISLSIIAVGMVWGVIKKQTAVLSPAFSCLDIQTQPPIEVSEAKTVNSKLEIKVSRKPTDETIINKMYFTIVYTDSTTDIAYAGNDCTKTDILAKGETKKYYFDIPAGKNPRQIAYGVNNCPVGGIDIS